VCTAGTWTVKYNTQNAPENAISWCKILKNLWGGGTAPSPDPSPVTAPRTLLTQLKNTSRASVYHQRAKPPSSKYIRKVVEMEHHYVVGVNTELGPEEWKRDPATKCPAVRNLKCFTFNELHWLDGPVYPLQTGSHSTSLSAVQGSCVPGRLLYTSLRHSQPTSFYGQPLDITWPYHVPGSAVSTFGCRAFSVAGSTAWYSLPDSLRDLALSRNSFRQSLKTNLFRRYHSAHTAQ